MAIHSGLAETARNLFIPLHQRYPDKYEIHQLGFFNFQPKEPVPFPIYTTKVHRHPDGRMEPDHNDRYGALSFHEVLDKVKPDIVFGYGDMWHFDHLLTSPLRNTYRLCTYYTIDGSPYYGGSIDKDLSTEWGRKLCLSDKIVTLSHFGKKVLKKSCKELENKDISVAYHPLDMSRFPLYNREQVLEARKSVLPAAMDPDIFIAGWMGRNQFRKQNYKLWEISHYIIHGDYIECQDCGRVTTKEWDPAARKSMPSNELTMYDAYYDYSHCWYCKSQNIVQGKPNKDYFLWLHMPKTDQGYNPTTHGVMWDIGNQMIFTSGVEGIAGVSKDQVAKLLSIWDVMLYPSGGEGFGNPPFEAMAAGTPVIYSNYSSHAEFCRFGGLPIRVANYTPELQISIFRSSVDTAHGVEQMLKCIRDRQLCERLGQAARRHAAQHAIPHITPVWDDIFTKMMEVPLPIKGDKVYSTSL